MALIPDAHHLLYEFKCPLLISLVRSMMEGHERCNCGEAFGPKESLVLWPYTRNVEEADSNPLRPFSPLI